MKETITNLICDDCKKRVKEFFYSNKIDLCLSCTTTRIQHSLSLVPSILCSKCKGTRLIEEWTGVGSDYISTTCDLCLGTGYKKLT